MAFPVLGKASEPTPERTAFVRFREGAYCPGLDRSLFEGITGQLKAKAIRVKTGTLVDATIIASASVAEHLGPVVQKDTLFISDGDDLTADATEKEDKMSSNRIR